MQTSLVSLRGIEKRYRRGVVEVRALSGIDLDLAMGDFMAVTGPSGSGKSTLLSIIGGVDRPSGGSYRFKGVDVFDFADEQLAAFRNRRVGIVFQSFNLLADLTAWQNVALPLYYAGTPLAVRRKRASEVLSSLGLGERLDHYPAELSGGEEQRVAFARAVVTEPDLIIADEPTGNLDSDAQRQVAGLLKTLHEAGRTVILATHNPDMADLARRRIELRDGIVVRQTD